MVLTQAGLPIVGRERELIELGDALAAARTGHGQALFISGEPGIGKSRLAAELAARASDAGALVLWGRGWEDAGAPPYWPWIQILRGVLRAFDAQAIKRLLGPGASDVAQLLPELRQIEPTLAEPANAASESARFQLFDSTVSLLRNAAAERPLLLALDDLQAADTPSILLLQFLVAQMDDMAVLVIGTYRDIEVGPDHPLAAALAEMARARTVRLLTLRGLSADAVGAYIGATANIDPAAGLAAAVWRETGGNPLFVGEAVRLLEAEGRLADIGDLATLRIVVPAGVRAVIARRIGLLQSTTAIALELGAAQGPEFSLDLLRSVGDLRAEDALDAIDEAVHAGLVLPVAGSIGRYRFSHDLVRETLYENLSTVRRIRLHRRIADALESTYARSLDAHLAELAFHFVEAALGSAITDLEASSELTAKAIDYARRAGDQAARSLAYEEAARLYAMALRVLRGERPGDTTDRDQRLEAQILIAAGDAAARAGDLDEARSRFLEASQIARSVSSGTLLAQAALGYGGRHQWGRAGHDTTLIPLLDDALQLLGDGDERLRVRLLIRMACAWRSAPERREDSARWSAEAVELARKLKEPTSLSYALSGRFWATWWPENPEEREALADEIVAIAEAVGDYERIAEAHLMRFLSVTERGLMAEARAEVEALARVITETRQPAQQWLEPVNRAELNLMEGDFIEAERNIDRELVGGFRVTPARDDVSAARMHRLLLRREQGRSGEEETTVRESVRDFPWYPMHKAALACLLLDVGRRDEARRIFDELAADDFAPIYRDNEWLLAMSFASEACARLGDRERAAVLYRQLLPFEGRHAIGHAEGSAGVVDRYLGLLAATLYRLDDAVRHLLGAIELLDQMGARPWKAHAQHDLAQVLRTRDRLTDGEQADELDREALETARTLGMALAAEIEPSIGADRAQSGSSAVSSAVFRREGDVWSIAFGAERCRLRDAKGMHYLASLLSRAGREIHSLDLVRLDGSASESPELAHDGPESDVRQEAFGGLGPVLDSKARAAYRARLAELRQELDEAHAWNDTERAARLQQEADALTHEIAAAVGLAGRSRSTGSSAERARVSVTRAIRTALGRIAVESPKLGAHLDATVHTGTFCSYVPDPRAPIAWAVSDEHGTTQTDPID
jgi:tetratricopeptide (TPR) repeat protein